MGDFLEALDEFVARRYRKTGQKIHKKSIDFPPPGAYYRQTTRDLPFVDLMLNRLLVVSAPSIWGLLNPGALFFYNW